MEINRAAQRRADEIFEGMAEDVRIQLSLWGAKGAHRTEGAEVVAWLEHRARVWRCATLSRQGRAA